MRYFLALAALAAAVASGCSRPLGPELTPRAVAGPGRLCRSDRVAARSAQVRWIRPSDPREQARLDAWCAAVGPVLLRARPAAAEARLEDVVFVSWNVHVGSADIERFVADLRSGRLSEGRAPAHVVLLFQEAVRGGGVPRAIPPRASVAGWIGPDEGDAVDVDALARALDMSVFYAPSMRNGAVSDGRTPTDRGNAILSTLPLADPAAIELPGDGQRRVAVAASIALDVNGRPTPFSVGAAHLATRATARTLWLFGAPSLRDRQARALAAALPDRFTIVGADLNSWSGGADEPAARDLRRAFPATPGGRRQPTFAFLVLDHMFFRAPEGWRARLVRAPERYGSDHYPLVGWLETT